MKYYLLTTDGTIKHIKKNNYILNINKKLKGVSVDDYIYTINTKTSSVFKYKLKKLMGNSLILKRRNEFQLYEVNVNDIWFDKIKNGSKIVEGRLDKGKFSALSVPSYVTFKNSKGAKVIVKVKDKIKYKSFNDMLREENIKHVLPGVESLVDGVAVYRKFYSEEAEKMHGVIAIRIEKINPHLM